jgi:hypothetical protein
LERSPLGVAVISRHLRRLLVYIRWFIRLARGFR